MQRRRVSISGRQHVVPRVSVPAPGRAEREDGEVVQPAGGEGDPGRQLGPRLQQVCQVSIHPFLLSSFCICVGKIFLTKLLLKVIKSYIIRTKAL